MATIPTRIGNYEILEQIGAGGMGVVYKARHARIRRDRIVALKLMLPAFTADAELQERFQREIDIVDKLQHPNIVAVLDAGEHDGQPYLVMEYLEGETLEKCITEKGLTLEKKLDVMAAVCRGLDFAHQQGIVHRDVKPANIFLLADLTPRILDFGVAHVSKNTMTKAGMMVGTINYMSPEQLNGQRVDGRSDVFSAGVVLYELVAGRVPFEGSDPVSTIKKILMDPVPPLWDYLDEYPPRLEKILATALSKEPGKRYQTAGAMADEINRVRGIASRGVAVAAAAAASPARVAEPIIEKPGIVAPPPDNPSQLLPTEIADEHDENRGAEREGLRATDDEMTKPPVTEDSAARAQTQPQKQGGMGTALLVIGVFALIALLVWWRSGTQNDERSANPGSSSPPVASQPPDPYPQAKQFYDQKDYAHALPLLQQAAEQGQAQAQFLLGLMYTNGSGVDRDYSLAFQWYRKAADQGHASAQNNLGLAYERGNGVEKDLVQAAQWYRKSADGGDATAQANMGYMYDQGWGVPKDYSQAMEWYRKAADQGNARAETNIGLLYEYGQGVTKDYSQAVDWYRKSAEKGYASGQYNLGDMYEYGKGVPRDLDQAIQWYRKAAGQGSAPATNALKRLGR